MGTFWNWRWAEMDRPLSIGSLENFRADQDPQRRTTMISGVARHVSKRNINDDLERRARFAADEVGAEWLEDSGACGADTHRFEGRPVTWSSVDHGYMAGRIFGLLAADGWRSFPRVVEVGKGFGGLAWSLCRRFSISDYVLIDHRSCLELQRHFLDRIRDGRRIDTKFSFVDLERFASYRGSDERFDLAINTRSFGEMEVGEVREYVGWFGTAARKVYTVNWERKVTAFDDYGLSAPIWQQVYRGPWPAALEDRMIEAAYRRAPEV